MKITDNSSGKGGREDKGGGGNRNHWQRFRDRDRDHNRDSFHGNRIETVIATVSMATGAVTEKWVLRGN